jgi:hypothetical protein
VIVFSFVITYAQKDLFHKSRSNYKAKSYEVEKMSHNSHGTLSFPYIYFNKRPIINKIDNTIFELKFGYKGINSEYLSFDLDTIFYYPYKSNQVFFYTKSVQNISKKPIFILKENNKDSIYIEEFGIIEKHYIFLESVRYHSSINDTVFVFKLKFQDNRPYPREETSRDLYYFDNIAISKKYGIVELSFIRFATWMRIKYY